MGRPNRINWYFAPEGAQFYEEFHCFMPGIDRSGDPLTGLYEYTRIRTTERHYPDELTPTGVVGDHVHGDADDFLGLSLNAKYGPRPAHPCGDNPIIPSTLRIGGQARHAPVPIFTPGLLLGGNVVQPPAREIDSGFSIGGKVSRATRLVGGGIKIGGPMVFIPARSVRGGVKLGGVAPRAVPEIGGGIDIDGRIAFIEGGVRLGGDVTVQAAPTAFAVLSLGGAVVPYSREAFSGLSLGGTVIVGNVQDLTAGLSVGGSATPATPMISGGLLIGGTLATIDGGIRLGGSAEVSRLSRARGGLLLGGNVIPGSRGVSGGVGLRGEIARITGNFSLGGSAEFEPIETAGGVSVGGGLIPPGGGGGGGGPDLSGGGAFSVLNRFEVGFQTTAQTYIVWDSGVCTMSMFRDDFSIAQDFIAVDLDTWYDLYITDDGTRVTATVGAVSVYVDSALPNTRTGKSIQMWDYVWGVYGRPPQFDSLSVSSVASGLVWNDLMTDANGTLAFDHTPDLSPGGAGYTSVGPGAPDGLEIQSNTMTEGGSGSFPGFCNCYFDAGLASGDSPVTTIIRFKFGL